MAGVNRSPRDLMKPLQMSTKWRRRDLNPRMIPYVDLSIVRRDTA
jgi:hypothetical protein